MYDDRETHHSAFGHVCLGGGAKIQNSPVNVTLNVTINVDENARMTDETGRPTELARTLEVLGDLIRGREDRRSGHDEVCRVIEAYSGKL